MNQESSFLCGAAIPAAANPDSPAAPVPRETKTPAQSEAVQVQIVGGGDLNGQMILFGGALIGWMDVCATYAARRHAGSKVVTVQMDGVEILASARADDGVELRAKPIYAGRTSLEVMVEAWKEDFDGTRTLLARAREIFVALGEDRRPREIPSLSPQTEEEKRLYADARARRELARREQAHREQAHREQAHREQAHHE